MRKYNLIILSLIAVSIISCAPIHEEKEKPKNVGEGGVEYVDSFDFSENDKFDENDQNVTYWYVSYQTEGINGTSMFISNTSYLPLGKVSDEISKNETVLINFYSQLTKEQYLEYKNH